MSDLIYAADGFEMLAHIPPGAGPGAPVLVAVHGISRNAREHLTAFADAAGDGAAILAPRFDAGRFPSYQRLGIGRDEPRADLMLDAALAQVAAQTGLDLRRPHLFGFSGGAQFAQRFAMLRPGAAASLHLASAGWYTFFDAAAPWPRGCARHPIGRRVMAEEAFFHRIPCHVHVGELDTDRDEALRTGPRVDAQQGANRRARAETWTGHIAARRGAHGAPIALSLLPGCGHDFADACDPAHGALPRRVLQGAGIAQSSMQEA